MITTRPVTKIPEDYPMTKARPHDQESLLARVWKARKAAVSVWVALTLLAAHKGRKRFAIKRRTLARLSGIDRIPTVSEALAALERLGVVQRQVRRCRRPDGTLFPRLHIRLVHQITKSVPGDRVRKTGYAPGTAPGNENRNHSPGTPDNEKRYTSPIGDGGACGVRKTPQRTHVAPAAAAGARRDAGASRRTPAGATCQPQLDSLSPAARTALDQLSAQIGCPVAAFDIRDGTALLEAAGLCLGVRPDGAIAFATNEETGWQPWMASAAQVQLSQRALTLAKEARPYFWSSAITGDQVELARAVALRVGCRLADFEPLGRSLFLGDSRLISCTGLVRIDPNGTIRFHRTVDGRRTEEPWQATDEQVECVRLALRQSPDRVARTQASP
jgi:hypothetical protein